MTYTLATLRKDSYLTFRESHGLNALPSVDKNLEKIHNVREVYSVPISEARLVKARPVFTRHLGTLRTSEAIRMGTHPRTLYAHRDSGEAEQVSRGFQPLSGKPAFTNPDLAAVVLRFRER